MTSSREFVAARSLSCDRCPTVLCITSLRSHGRLRRENIDRPPVHTEAYRKLSYEIHVTCYSFHLKLRCCSYLQSDKLLNSDWEAQWTRYSYWREAPFIARYRCLFIDWKRDAAEGSGFDSKPKLQLLDCDVFMRNVHRFHCANGLEWPYSRKIICIVALRCDRKQYVL